MQFLDLTLPGAEENLALDEALLEECEAGRCGGVLRVWESPSYFVVLGYTNRRGTEVDLAACRQRGVPVLRRTSGGGTVVQGPGCLSYALVLRNEQAAELKGISETNHFVMGRHREAISLLVGRPVEVNGHTDLAIGGRKFSGNAQRRKRCCLLFHGTFLLQADLDLIAELLPMPSQQPDYRGGRAHADFLTNLSVPAEDLKAALRQAWQADEPMAMWPRQAVARLVEERYARPEWIGRF